MMKKINIPLILLAAVLLIACQTARPTGKMDKGMAPDMKSEMPANPTESGMMTESKDKMNADMPKEMKDTGMTKDPMKPEMMPESKDKMNADTPKEMKDTGMTKDPMKPEMMPESKDKMK